MLERRVSNNQADLNSDQQMNYFLAWFQTWSDLQKSDFVPILADKMGAVACNGDHVSDAFSSLEVNSSRPPSLFKCQVKLFNDYFAGWSDDQKNYLVLRLKDIDPEFFQKYESYLDDPSNLREKDYFDPGVPDHLVKLKTTVASPTPPPTLNGNHEEDDEDLKKKTSVVDSPVPFATISEEAE